MTTRFSYAKLVLCAALLSVPAYANIPNPGAGAYMPPAPGMTVNLGGSPDGSSAQANGNIAVIQAFPNQQISLRDMDGASMFWLGMLSLLGATLFATGTALIAQSTQAAKTAAPKTGVVAKARVAAPVVARVRAPAAV